jgi:hypothetical protein
MIADRETRIFRPRQLYTGPAERATVPVSERQSHRPLVGWVISEIRIQVWSGSHSLSPAPSILSRRPARRFGVGVDMTEYFRKANLMLAINVPPKALVWPDDQGKIWLTFNSGEYLQNYVYPRHGLPSNQGAARSFDEFVRHAAEQATE